MTLPEYIAYYTAKWTSLSIWNNGKVVSDGCASAGSFTPSIILTGASLFHYPIPPKMVVIFLLLIDQPVFYFDSVKLFQHRLRDDQHERHGRRCVYQIHRYAL